MEGFALTEVHGIPTLLECTVYVTHQNGCLLRVDFPSMDDLQCYEWGKNFFRYRDAALLALSFEAQRAYEMERRYTYER